MRSLRSRMFLARCARAYFQKLTWISSNPTFGVQNESHRSFSIICGHSPATLSHPIPSPSHAPASKINPDKCVH